MASRLILAALFVGLTAAQAGAADIFRAEPIMSDFVHVYPSETIGDPLRPGDVRSFADAPHLRVEGRIEPGDAERLGALLKEELPNWQFDMFNNVVVSFDSDGGNFYEGLAMADVISDYAVGTFVGPGDRCLSSCAIAFLGGSEIVLRGIPSWPRRFIHTDGQLGFHAPFSEIPSAIQVPTGTPLSDSITQQMAESFYGQAQAAINEIAGRISDWQISPDFVFNMLTKDSYVGDTRPISERFVIADSYKEAEQLNATVLTSALHYPTEITGVGAAAACEFLVAANTGRSVMGLDMLWPVSDFAQHSTVGSGGWEGYPITVQGRYPEVLSRKTDITTYRRLFPGNDPNAYFGEFLLSGLGGLQCSVYRSEGGRWYAQSFNEEVHYPDREGTYVRGRGADLVDVKVLDFDGGYPINDFLLLGAYGSWSSPPVLTPGFFEQLPEDVKDIEGASFDCGGDLDPAAEVICAFPALANADGRMGELFRQARAKVGDAVLAEQREWIALRDRVCRPERVDLTNEFVRWNLAACLMNQTSGRNRELALQLR